MKLKSKLLFPLLFLPVIVFCQSHSAKFKDGGELIKGMYSAYAPDKWYRYFTFSQDMDFYRNDSLVKKDVWHEAYQPGCLLLKFGEKNSKTGRLYKDFTQYAFKEGEEMHKTPRIHELLLVGLDVYFFDPNKTVKILDSLGYNLTKIREDEFSGRKVYVVGADKGDDKSKQFWIDAERLYMHRIVYEQKGKINDVVFDEYTKMDGNWIAKKIVFKTDGKLALIEKYFAIRFPKKLNPDLFSPEKFNEIVLE